MLGANDVSRAQREREFDCVAELANVPGPGIGREGPHGVLGERHALTPGALRMTFEQPAGDQRDVFEAITQRGRRVDAQRTQAVVEILAKLLRRAARA